MTVPMLSVITPSTPLDSGFVYDRGGNLWLSSHDSKRIPKRTFYGQEERATKPAGLRKWKPLCSHLAWGRTLQELAVLNGIGLFLTPPDSSNPQFLVPGAAHGYLSRFSR